MGMRLISLILIFNLYSFSLVSAQEKYELLVWVGYHHYKMEDFNKKLSDEKNNTINEGLNAGVELPLVDFLMNFIVKKWLGLVLPLKFPIGIEYLEAHSKTVHTSTDGSATVNWTLPIIGFYIAPTIEKELYEIKSLNAKLNFLLRPIGVGYYTLGKIMDAKLTVTDRPGSLHVYGETVGICSRIGVKLLEKKQKKKRIRSGGHYF